MAPSCQRECRRKPCCPTNCTCCASWPRSCSKKSCWNLRKCACLNRADCAWNGRCEPGYRASCDTGCPAPTNPTPPLSAGGKGGAKAAKAVHKYVVAEQNHQAARLYAAGVRDHTSRALAGGASGKEARHLQQQSRKAAKLLHRAERHRAKSYSKVLKAGGCGCA